MAIAKYEKWLESENLQLIKEWAESGLTNEQIASNMGITRETLRVWCKDHSAISDTLKEGKEVADIEVENALYKKALGYNAEIRKTFKCKTVLYDKFGKRKSEKEELVIGVDEVHVPADTTAQIFWLKNRNPESWRDKHEQTITGDVVLISGSDKIAD